MQILTEEMLFKIREKRKTDHYYAFLIDHAVIDRARETAEHPGIRRPEDSQDWWRCLNRIEIAALAHLFAPQETRIQNWLHDALKEITDMPDDQWIGPFFRPRCDPPQGMLETSAILVAVTEALGICPDILSRGETDRLLDRIRKVGLPYSRNWISAREKEGTFGSNNWSIVLLCGYAYGAALTEDEDALRFVTERCNYLCRTMNEDFYGETTDYWSYASSQFALIRLLLEAVRPDLASELLPVSVYAGILPWCAAQVIGPFRCEALTEPIPLIRWVNFSDANAIERMDATTLASIAIRKKEMPQLASLASHLFFRTYAPETLYLQHEDRLGFWKTVTFWLALLYPDFADPKKTPPEPAVQRFGDGLTVLKGEKLQFFSRAGSTIPSKAIEHRHADQGTVFAAYNGVVLLDDPGSCCYRLPLYEEEKKDSAHSLPLFRIGNTPLPQRILGSGDADHAPLNRDAGHETGKDFFMTTSDMADLYPKVLTKVLRTVWAEEKHIAFIADEWEAEERVTEETRFVFNNRRMAMEWRISGNECRMTREGVGVRVISLDGCIPELGYGTLNDANHVHPGAPTQGRQGNGYVITFGKKEEEAKGHRRFLLIFDCESRLDRWRFFQKENAWFFLSPDGKEYAEILGNNVLLKRNGASGHTETSLS